MYVIKTELKRNWSEDEVAIGKENWVDTQKWNNRKINKGYGTEKDVEY